MNSDISIKYLHFRCISYHDLRIHGRKTIWSPAVADKDTGDWWTPSAWLRTETKCTEQVQIPQLHGNGGTDPDHLPITPSLGLKTQTFQESSAGLKDFRFLSHTFTSSEVKSRGWFGWPRINLSVVGTPVTVVAGHEATGDEQDEVHKPPDAQASQCEQLPHRSPRVAKTEAVNPKAAQEEGVEQRCDEVVPRVSAQKHAQMLRLKSRAGLWQMSWDL